MTQILIIDPDLPTCRWLEAVFNRDGIKVELAHNGSDAQKQFVSSRPDVLVLEVDLPDMNGIELIRQLRSDSRGAEVGIIVLSSRMKITEIQAGLDAGADEYLAKRPGVDIELAQKIRTLAARNKHRTYAPPVRSNGQAHVGRIVSFCSAKGGTGTTSVCINTAYAVAQAEARAKICVVDMVLPLGMVGQSIGYESPQTIARYCQSQNGPIGPSTLKPFISAEPEYGFHVLLGANDLKEANAIDNSRIACLFEALRLMFDYVFVDFGRALNSVSLPIIQSTDAVVIVLTSDPSVIKLTKQVLTHLETEGIPRQRITLVNNRVIARSWMSNEEIENQLRLALATSIPHELDDFSAASNAGMPFMAKFPERAASQSFAEFATRLVETTSN